MRAFIFVIGTLLMCPGVALAQVRATFILPESVDVAAPLAAVKLEPTPETIPKKPELPKHQPSVFTGYLPAVVSGLDLASTAAILNRGGHETNPVLGRSMVQIAVTKVALTGVLVYALRKAEPHHPKAAKIIGVCATVAFGAAAAKNLHGASGR